MVAEIPLPVGVGTPAQAMTTTTTTTVVPTTALGGPDDDHHDADPHADAHHADDNGTLASAAVAGASCRCRRFGDGLDLVIEAIAHHDHEVRRDAVRLIPRLRRDGSGYPSGPAAARGDGEG